MQTIIDFVYTLFTSFVEAIYVFGEWIADAIIYGLMVCIQAVVVAFVGIANAAVSLMPLCDVPFIDLSYVEQSATMLQTVAWVLPVGYLTSVVLCLINAVLAYLAISWALRWVKVIK